MTAPDALLKVRRPHVRGFVTRRIARMLPPAPAGNVDYIEPAELARRHYVLGAVSVVVVVTVSWLLWRFDPLHHNVITLVAAGVTFVLTGSGVYTDGAGVSEGVVAIAVLVVVVGIIVMMGDRSAMAWAAVKEEMIFRAGAEGWTWKQRLASCALFGTVHLTNLIVPLAIVPGLAASGLLFMGVYLRQHKVTGSQVRAIREAGAVHAAHNRLVWLATPVVFAGWVLVTFAA